MRSYVKRWLPIAVALFFGIGIGANSNAQPTKAQSTRTYPESVVAPEVCEHNGIVTEVRDGLIAGTYSVRCASGIWMTVDKVSS